MGGDTTVEEMTSHLAAHYVAQRKKSVKGPVPMHYWVRLAHTKGMAMHAREPIYVLDVPASGNARMQVNAYEDQALPEGDAIQTGTIAPLVTHSALQLMQALVQEGILPTVLILRWKETGNHFTGVVYDQERFNRYSRHLDRLNSRRNEIQVQFLGTATDPDPYDPLKTAKAALRELKVIKKAAKSAQSTQNPGTAGPQVDEETHKMTDDELTREAESDHEDKPETMRGGHTTRHSTKNLSTDSAADDKDATSRPGNQAHPGNTLVEGEQSESSEKIRRARQYPLYSSGEAVELSRGERS
ncbi:hypothetical protein PF010_g17757 [Phytophthora fragariae]|uniref:Uncharacterized protein n=2 Tax=Phytophthora fragariae TaxID=53985 RepID=A0A6A3XT97_9STRA|nr:hypothetical protein PF009_g19639 [Phytophthora fragariae]KAE8995356.1 hypothetical protein PF011_g16365 [Phytophthora fragariae]KAE9092429.1 hypothetical protein PF007_g18515 [Phytophthora fragariae]KAE9092692.1 hypothetical protein PF010_g17757 [Phytophthora fragariae]KAE9117735.1 hypothetical protein PF006_g18750 [Phytophthora fragariae]